MSGLLTNKHFKDYFDDPNSAQIGTMVAILEIGALISALLSGRISDKIGRRRAIRYGAMLFAVGGALQAFALTFRILIISRFISGLGIGVLTQIVPVYQSEISPSHKRGLLACVEFTGNIIGYSASVWTDYFCSTIQSNMSWRLPLSIQSLIAIGLFFGSYVIVESPRWLLSKDHDAEGIVVIADLTTKGNVQDERARNEFRDIKETVVMHRLEGESSYSYMFKRYKRRVFIAMSAQGFAQMNGINVISYYAPLVFEQAGWKGRRALLMTGINSLFYVASTIPPWILVDKWGRRPILLSGALIMGISLTLISYSLYLNTERTRHLVVILVIIFNAGFGYSFGPIPWLYPAEIAPLSVRSKITSLSTASNWFFNWLVGELTPILQELMTWRLYLIFSTSCFISFFVVYYLYPETAGVTLEDMDSIFDDRSSTFSSKSSSSYHPIDQDDETPGGNVHQNLSGAAVARQQALFHSQNDSLQTASPLLHKQRSETSFRTQLNQFHPQSNNISSAASNYSVEPPEFHEIVKFKNSDQQSLTSSIRRSSNTVSTFVGNVFNKKAKKTEGNGDNAVESDQESLRSQDRS
jgi:sugar porter (SP) family MFS transporter